MADACLSQLAPTKLIYHNFTNFAIKKLSPKKERATYIEKQSATLPTKVIYDDFLSGATILFADSTSPRNQSAYLFQPMHYTSHTAQSHCCKFLRHTAYHRKKGKEAILPHFLCRGKYV